LPKPVEFNLKCSKMRWQLGLRPRPRWGSSAPDPLIVSGFVPKALAPRPLRRLEADPLAYFGQI